jgi:hypothetical protein
MRSRAPDRTGRFERLRVMFLQPVSPFPVIVRHHYDQQERDTGICKEPEHSVKCVKVAREQPHHSAKQGRDQKQAGNDAAHPNEQGPHNEADGHEERNTPASSTPSSSAAIRPIMRIGLTSPCEEKYPDPSGLPSRSARSLCLDNGSVLSIDDSLSRVRVRWKLFSLLAHSRRPSKMNVLSRGGHPIR